MHNLTSFVGQTPIINLNRLFKKKHIEVSAKLEMVNLGGSIKDRPAIYMLNQAWDAGKISKNSHIIESSSGNLAIALAMFCNLYELKFTAVVDPNISPTNLKLIKLYGANVIQVTKKDSNNGYLQTRIDTIKQLAKEVPNAFWINQYANPDNWKSHYYGEAEEIVKQVCMPIDYLVLSVSTTGTLLGISKRLKKEFPHMKVIAVDLIGSVLFGGQPGLRRVPGIGASRLPELYDPEMADEVIRVSDYDCAVGCRDLLDKESIFAGGSSGANMAAIRKLIATIDGPAKIMTLLPDRGDRYLDSIYDDDWVANMQKHHYKMQQEKVLLTA